VCMIEEDNVSEKEKKEREKFYVHTKDLTCNKLSIPVENGKAHYRQVKNTYSLLNFMC
jgi:hypothetical protein